MKVKFRSREGHERWVLEKLKNKKNGYFIDIGAHDGYNNSNTWTLEKYYEWQGICVEPNPSYRGYPTLLKNRNCICENLCISDKNEMVPFVARGRSPEVSGICNDLANPLIPAAVKKGHPVIQVQAITLDNLLKKHNSPMVIDYLSVDTEGHELNVLKSVDLNEYTFLTLTVEHNYVEGTGWRQIDLEKRKNMKELLLSHGYIFDRAKGSDDWYVHKSLA